MANPALLCPMPIAGRLVHAYRVTDCKRTSYAASTLDGLTGRWANSHLAVELRAAPVQVVVHSVEPDFVCIQNSQHDHLSCAGKPKNTCLNGECYNLCQ